MTPPRLCQLALIGLVVLIALAVPAPARAAADPAVLIKRFLRQESRSGEFSGSVLVARRGSILVNTGYQLANTRKHIKNKAGTLFGMTGETDTFTAAAIMQLEEKGKLSLDDSVCVYLPSCPASWQPITIEDLLIHSSGLFDPPNDDPDFSFKMPLNLAQMLAEDKVHPLYFQPGTDFSYSTQDYILLALIVERISGLSYAAYVRTNIFAPLAMTRSGVPETGTPLPALAVPYIGQDVGPVISRRLSWESPGGTMYSTVGDLYRWDQALTGGTLLSSASLSAIFASHYRFPDGSGVGYGWNIGLGEGHPVFASGGTFPGLRSVNNIYPTEGLIIIVLDNQSHDNLKGLVDALAYLATGS